MATNEINAHAEQKSREFLKIINENLIIFTLKDIKKIFKYSMEYFKQKFRVNGRKKKNKYSVEYFLIFHALLEMGEKKNCFPR